MIIPTTAAADVCEELSIRRVGIVGVAKGTSVMISDSHVGHLADIASGPSGCPRNREMLDSKVQNARDSI
jgi:hypothetical protein